SSSTVTGRRAPLGAARCVFSLYGALHEGRAIRGHFTVACREPGCQCVWYDLRRERRWPAWPVKDRRKVLGSPPEILRSPATRNTPARFEWADAVPRSSCSVSKVTEPLSPGRQTPPRMPSTLAAAAAL